MKDAKRQRALARARRLRKRRIRRTVLALIVALAMLAAMILLTRMASPSDERRAASPESTPQLSAVPEEKAVFTSDPTDGARSTPTAAHALVSTPTARSASTPAPTPSPSPTPQPTPVLHELGEIDAAAQPSNEKLDVRVKLYAGTQPIDSYTREQPIAMGTEGYAQLEGVTTFRGDNLRNNAAYGTVPENARALNIEWKVRVGGIDDWTGVGWTGQPAIVRWPESTRAIMNINKEKRNKEGLVEVIYAALDGKIRFLDLEDGEPTRDPIVIGAPIKGSVTVDPRGIPLLYCGQGIDTVNGRSVKIGTRIFSLINQETLYFLNGRDELRTRNWYAFDSAPLIDGATDTMLQLGENGLVYSIDLNTRYDEEARRVDVSPQVVRYAYRSSATKRPGMENSIAVYNHYGYFADNSGLLQCVDLNDMSCKWAYRTGDDTDATTAVEEDDEGVWLYTANEIDLRGERGQSNIRCLNALTGALRWQVDIPVSESDRGGSYGSPAVGKRSLSNLVFYNLSKTKQGGTLFALDKQSGEIVWSHNLKRYSWSTPLLLYDNSDAGYVVIANSGGTLLLLDGQNGNVLDQADLGRNVEGSPAAFDDMIVVGTRGGSIYGVRVK